MAMTPDELLTFLDELEIQTETIEHPPVFTVEEAKRLRGPLDSGHCKSLFLRNKKGAMWLVVLLEDTTVDLRRLAELLGAGRFGFASPERLDRYLGVIPGAVTPFAVVNDVDRHVNVALERGLLSCDPLHFHPLDNTRTTAISPAGLLEFLAAVDHPPTLIDQRDL